MWGETGSSQWLCRLGGRFLSALDDIVVLVHVYLKVRHKRQDELDQFIHATLMFLLELQEAL